MDHFEPAISFEVPTSMNFDTFTTSVRDRVNDSVSIIGSQKATEIAAASAGGGDGLLIRKLSEKLGRGLSSSEVSMIRNQVVLNGSSFGVEEWQKQMEYDKFMNEIWIGIVLTLIVISLVFCICSCFLYHQFRHWKRNYRQNVRQNYDIESAKLNMEEDDPVPSYTLVSGLPTYDAALEQLRKSSTCSSSTLIDYPSVYKVFSVVEKPDQTVDQQLVQQSVQQSHQQQQQPQQQQQQQQQSNSTTQLKHSQKTSAIPTYEEATIEQHTDDPERTSCCEKKLLEVKT